MDIRISPVRRGYEFENLVRDLFVYYGYSVEQDQIVKINGRFDEVDLIITNTENEKILVEIKIYATRKVNYGILKKACLKLKSSEEIWNVKKQLLVIAGTIDEQLKCDLEKDFQLKVYDSKNIIYLIKENERLYKKYKELMSDIPDEIYKSEEIIETDIGKLFSYKNYDNKIFEYKREGDKLIKELEDIEPGVNEFSKYEKKCTEILRYLFPENLNGWKEQSTTDDSLNRFDLVCRVRFGNEFWEFLINEFKSRYVIFEFKNYRDYITQGQIYTTEKYLFQKALRNVGFIISPKGAKENAVKATKGILRETGKLIINLNNDDMKKMLNMKDSGEEPSDYLF